MRWIDRGFKANNAGAIVIGLGFLLLTLAEMLNGVGRRF